MEEFQLYSWGSNSNGQLGQGSRTESVDVPKIVPTSCEIARSMKNAVKNPSFVGGGNHSLILAGDGRVYGSGLDTSGQLDVQNCDGVNFTRIENLTGKTISSAACGWDFSLFLTDEGLLYGCGSNKFGQLGQCNGTKVAAIHSEEKFAQISAGMRHAAAVTISGSLLTWGFDRYINANQSKGLMNMVRVACGQHHISALGAMGNVVSWGANRYGQCGVNPDLFKVISEPSLVILPEDSGKVVDVVSGWTHTMVLTELGHVYTWGRNTYGQLGRTSQSDFQPFRVPLLDNIKSIVAGSEHSMALDVNGQLWTWGWNEHGSCGNGTQNDQFCPENISHNFKGKIDYIGAGAGHSFALEKMK